MRNFNYYLFIFFSFIFSLFFIRYHSYQPKVLGTTTSSSGGYRKFINNADGTIMLSVKGNDNSWCKSTDASSKGPGTCEDQTGKYSDHCVGNSSQFYHCDETWPKDIHSEAPLSVKCASISNDCSMGTKCSNGYCPTGRAQPPFSSVQSNDNTWCITGNFGAGYVCEDQTGKYTSSCQYNVFQNYKCKSSNDADPYDDRGGVYVGDTFYNNYGKIPSGVHCVKDVTKNCSDDTKCVIDTITRKSGGVLGGCLAADETTTSSPKEINSYNSNDGTWCKVSNNNTSCQDNSGNHANFCSGNTAQKYYCTGTLVKYPNYKDVKCTVGEFSCSKSCNQGICVDAISQVVPTSTLIPTPTPIIITIISTPTPEPEPTAFDPTPHRGNVSFWQVILSLFKPSQ